MGLKEARPIAVLTKRGSGLVIPVSAAWIKKLGWNRNDHLHMTVQDGFLVVKRIDLPRAPDLRVKVAANG